MSKATHKAYSYVRFSTPEQAKGDSRRRQTDLAARYVAQHGLVLDTELNLQDLGVSAFRGSNELAALGGFQKAIEDGLVEPGSVLLVESLDRISRKVARKAIGIIEEIVDSGVDVVTLNDNKRYDKAALDGFDFVMALVILMRGHEESATKSKRLKAAWHAKRESGKFLTRVVPGWIQTVDGKPKLHPDRARVVRRIFEMFVAGAGKSSIVHKLNAEKVPVFGGAQFWYPSYVQKILRSEAAAGIMIPHVETYEDGKMVRVPQEPREGYYPAAVKRELWNRAQVLLSTVKRTKATRKPIKNILAGLAVCPKCGATMTRVSKGANSKAGPPKLVCSKAKAGAGCVYRGVRLEVIVQAFTRHWNMAWPNADTSIDEELRGLEAAHEGLIDKIDKILAAIGSGKPGKYTAASLAAHEAQAELIAGKLAALQERALATDTRVMKLRAAKLRKVLKAVPFDIGAANTMLREILASVVVDYEAETLRLSWHHDGETEIPYVDMRAI